MHVDTIDRFLADIPFLRTRAALRDMELPSYTAKRLANEAREDWIIFPDRDAAYAAWWEALDHNYLFWRGTEEQLSWRASGTACLSPEKDKYAWRRTVDSAGNIAALAMEAAGHPKEAHKVQCDAEAVAGILAAILLPIDPNTRIMDPLGPGIRSEHLALAYAIWEPWHYGYARFADVHGVQYVYLI